VAVVAADVMTYGDSGLAASATFAYRVSALNDGGDSAYPNPASVTTSAVVTASSILTQPTGNDTPSRTGVVQGDARKNHRARNAEAPPDRGMARHPGDSAYSE
jgi:hypothetical protein